MLAGRSIHASHRKSNTQIAVLLQFHFLLPRISVTDNFGGQRSGNANLAFQCQSVEALDDISGGGERTFHAIDKVRDNIGVNTDLPV
jgi:hypothetical protein